MKVTINIIDHKEQRYDTVGDWQFVEGGIQIDVSKLGNFYEEMLVGIHELCEVVCCMRAGVSQLEVDKFDTEYETKRPDGDTSEPGDDIRAPYYKQHQLATIIERMLARELNINWNEYNNKVESLSQ